MTVDVNGTLAPDQCYDTATGLKMFYPMAASLPDDNTAPIVLSPLSTVVLYAKPYLSAEVPPPPPSLPQPIFFCISSISTSFVEGSVLGSKAHALRSCAIIW